MRAEFPHATIEQILPDHFAPVELAVDAEGNISLGGDAHDLIGLGEALRRSAYPPVLQMTVAPELPFSEFMPVLETVSATTIDGVAWENLQGFRNALAEQPAGTQPAFRGVARRFEFPVVVSYSPEADRCHAFSNGRSYGVAALADHAFGHLDKDVQHLGGPNVLMSDPELLAALVATIQSSGETPWKCLAGASFAVARAGYPAIRYEHVGQE